MGRMLEALQQIEARSARPVPPAEPLPAPAGPPQPAAAAEVVRDAAAVESVLTEVEAAVAVAASPVLDESWRAKPPELETWSPESLLVETSPIAFLPEEPAWPAEPPAEAPPAAILEEVPVSGIAEPTAEVPPPKAEVAQPEIQVVPRPAAVAYPYGELAAHVIAQLPTDGSAVLVFACPCDEDHDPQMLAPLAQAVLPQVEGEVLLVEAGERESLLAECLGTTAAAGRADLFAHAGNWRRRVRDTAVPRLHYLSAVAYAEGVRPPSQRDPDDLLSQLRRACRLVLIDAGPLVDAAAGRIAASGDGVYLVLRLGHTTPRTAREGVEVIEGSGGHLLGCVVLTT